GARSAGSGCRSRRGRAVRSSRPPGRSSGRWTTSRGRSPRPGSGRAGSPTPSERSAPASRSEGSSRRRACVSSRSLPSIARGRSFRRSRIVPVAGHPALLELVVLQAGHDAAVGELDPRLLDPDVVGLPVGEVPSPRLLGSLGLLGLGLPSTAELGLDGTASGECEHREQDDARSAGDAGPHRVSFRYTAWPREFSPTNSTGAPSFSRAAAPETAGPRRVSTATFVPPSNTSARSASVVTSLGLAPQAISVSVR